MLSHPKRVQVIETGNHIMAIYHDKETEFEEAFEFSNSGLEKKRSHYVNNR